MQDTMNVLYQFNEKYAPYAGVSITSLFENNKNVKSISIYILGEELSDESINRFNILAQQYGRKIYFVDTNKMIDTMKNLNMPTYRGSFAANMRLFISEIPDINGRLLYMDADTIVTGELASIYDSDIKSVGMVYDTLSCNHKYDIGLNKDDGYFNSGVILYDLTKWKEKDYTKQIVNHVQNVRAQYPSPDQDLLNVVLRGDIEVLPASCNYQPHLRVYPYDVFMKIFKPYPFYSRNEVEEAGKNPVIMHAFRYIGEFPWHKNNLHPFNDIFDYYLGLSPWKDYIKESAEGGLVSTVERILYKILPKAVFLRLFKIMHRRFFKKAEKLSLENKISSNM